MICKSLPHGTGFESTKESLRATKIWHCMKPGGAIGEVADSVLVETPEGWICQDYEVTMRTVAGVT